jgi:hypothetical protein
LTGRAGRVVLDGGRWTMPHEVWALVLLLAVCVLGEFVWIIRLRRELRKERGDNARLRDLVREMQSDGRRAR